MSIVPVFRLRANPGKYQRYRFSRDGHPNPNPTPGERNPDPDSLWSVDRVAFYAWSDPIHDEREGTINGRLVPVYEFYRIGKDGLVSYRYSTEDEPPPGWISRDYVSFWMYPAETDNAGAPVYVHSQDTPVGTNYALAVVREHEGWVNEGVRGTAAAEIPVIVSVRRDDENDQFLWSYAPSTINVVYPATLRFMQAPQSRWRFTRIEFVDGDEDFGTPIVTDARVFVSATFANPGTDNKVRITIDYFEGPRRVVSSGSAAAEGAAEDRRSAGASAISDPDVARPRQEKL